MIVAACSAGEPTSSSRAPIGSPGPTVVPGPREPTRSALDDPADPTLPRPSIDLDELVSGGPPPDGIPPIDRPAFLPARDVDFIDADEPVLALEIAGDVRAYPVQVMIWHEIVNDVVGGIPVTVTYCPLCNSAVAFERTLGSRILDFGTSGLLYRSALVMYDRQTESLWSHFTGEAIAGALTGSELDTHAVATVSWRQFRSAYPDGLVLTRDTGVARDYGTNPYPGYDRVGTAPFLFRGETDGRLEAKARIVGIERNGDAVAVRLDELRRRGVVEVVVDGLPIVVFHVPGTASALDTASIASGVDIGTTGVFVARVRGADTTFRTGADGFVDAATSTTWDALGRPVGPAASAAPVPQLERVAHVDTFWFAWAAFRPATRIVG